ncbi:MAG: hypothetical protein ACFFDK_09815, partial [Promethearchaeota archaeon]
MGIKKGYYITIFIILYFLIFLSYYIILTDKSELLANGRYNSEKVINRRQIDPKKSDLELPDKVYTFLAPSDNWTFEKLYLEKEYMYYIYIELVTPHNISVMRITIWDPDGKQFNVFESNMFFNPKYGRYFEIPFGTEMTGQYRIEFYSESEVNFNLYIFMEQGPICLYDKIDSKDQDKIILHEVTTFDNNKYKEHDIDLKTDVSYKLVIGRVSAISIKESNIVRLDYTIEDPDGIEFIIYTNGLLADINGVNSSSFGTATGGNYEIKLRIYCDVAYVNIAYAIIEDYQISNVIEVNETESQSSDKSDEVKLIEALSNNAVSLPIEWTIATIIFVSTISGA